ncbi:MAG: 1-acyl-sn-glycerol-3-phosphate acyltransferase [Acidimicrobiales bacterium]|nr:MAG: 1-acyl-sn-glycerol-3-phosphate acyltransferase [Acidimicrobiales bacterium]
MGQTFVRSERGGEVVRGAPVPLEEIGSWQPAARVILKPLIWFFWRVEAEGVENVPAEGPAILCPNHRSFIDSLFLPACLDRPVTYVGKAEYLDSWKTRILFPKLGMIPIDRSGGRASEAALEAAQRVLESGGLFGIYPEGTRSRDGKLHRGHTGAARLALRTGAPLIPVGILGTAEIQPPDSVWPRPFRTVRVRFGRPIDVSKYRDRKDDRLVLRQITDEVMFEIKELTGFEYVDTYATRKPEAIPAREAQVGAPSGGVVRGGDELPRRSSAEVLTAGR